MRPASRSGSSQGSRSCQATRLWICSRSTRPPKKASWSSSWRAGLLRRGRPDLRRDDRLVATLVRAHVRGRPRPDRTSATSRRALTPAAKAASTTATARGLVRWGDIEHLPRTEPDDRHGLACCAEARAAPSRGAWYGQRHGGRRAPGGARALARADRRSLRRRELSRRLAARPARGAAAPARGLRLRPARRQPRRRGGGRPRRAPRRARARARRCYAAATDASCDGCRRRSPRAACHGSRSRA